MHYIYYVLYFYSYYISPTSDHLALDPRGWEPLDKTTIAILQGRRVRQWQRWELNPHLWTPGLCPSDFVGETEQEGGRVKCSLRSTLESLSIVRMVTNALFVGSFSLDT